MSVGWTSFYGRNHPSSPTMSVDSAGSRVGSVELFVPGLDFYGVLSSRCTSKETVNYRRN